LSDGRPGPTEGRFHVLVTGATGFLGRHVLGSLRRQVPSARVLVLVRDPRVWKAQEWRAEAGSVEVIAGDLVETAAWANDPRLDGLQAILHLAAEVKHARSEVAGMRRTNVEGTASMVRLAAQRGARMLFVSTSGTVACSPRPGNGVYEDAPHRDEVVGGWPYYASKIEAERRAREVAGDAVELVIVRPPVLLGPGDHRFRSTGHVLRVLHHRVPFVLPGGMHFVDVRDAADALVRAVRYPRPRPVYHLRGTATTLDAFFRLVAEEAGIRPRWKRLPSSVILGAARLNRLFGSPVSVIPDPVLIEMAAHHWDIGSRHAEDDLGFRSRPPERTIADTVAWLRAHHPELRGE
jgi:dihydroflavonol-4-reductase